MTERFEIVEDGPMRFVLVDNDDDQPAPVYATRKTAENALRLAQREEKLWLLKRLPLVRHIRWLIAAWRVERHYQEWSILGALPVNRDKDEKILRLIWDGKY